MKKLVHVFSLFLLATAFISCNLDDSKPTNVQDDDTFAENFGSAVNRDFIGQVVDVDNHPIQGVTISIGTSSTLTDSNGIFVINNAPVHQNFAYIKAIKTGYINGSRSMIPTTGKNNVKIMLMPYAPLETIQSDVESEVSIYSGTKVKFDGAFQDENGNDYSGVVSVSMFHLTPSDENISKLMPGMLYAQAFNNSEAMLQTYGMINVELRGSTGQRLNIKKGHKAEITLRIDDSQLATAPSTIPLWHFDEEKGYWKEDGLATKVGNKYVGEVSHFSWWNCDYPYPTVSLTVKVVDNSGNPISNVGVGLTLSGATFPVLGYTNVDGIVAGLIPANQTLTMNVYSDYSNCNSNNIVYTTTIGPFNTDTILPNVVITSTANVLISEVQGTLLKCDNTNVTNGYVVLSKYGNMSFSPVTNGAFSFHEIYCSNDTQFTLKGVDIENFQQTDTIAYNFTVPLTTIGNLQACNAIDEFISYQLDSQPTVFLVNNVAAYQLQTALTLQASGQENQSLYIWGNTMSPGIYDSTTFIMEGYPVGFVDSTTPNTMQYNLNQVGAVGEFVDMTFSGTYNDQTGVHTITGVAHIRRDN